MILSLSRMFLFIHVAKVAGTSIVHALGGSDIRKECRSFPRRTKALYLRRVGIHPSLFQMHDHAPAQRVRDVVTPKLFNRLYKVGFVRNPWDLQLSLYKYNLKYPQYQKPHRDFSSFEKFIMSAPMDRFPQGHQKRFLYDEDGRQLVDFIGRYETLENDFHHICEQIGLDDVRLAHRNATEHDPWPSYYTRETFEHIRKFAALDIAAFGYPDDPAAYSIH